MLASKCGRRLKQWHWWDEHHLLRHFDIVSIAREVLQKFRRRHPREGGEPGFENARKATIEMDTRLRGHAVLL